MNSDNFYVGSGDGAPLLNSLFTSRGVARGAAAPNDRIVGALEMLKSAIKSIHCEVALKKQVQLLFSFQKGGIFIPKRAFP